MGEIAILGTVTSLVLGIGGAILVFGRAEGRRDQRLQGHEERIDNQAAKLGELREETKALDHRTTIVEQNLVHLSTMVREVRDDVKRLLEMKR